MIKSETNIREIQIVEQPPKNSTIRLNRSYLFSLRSLLCFLILIAQFGALVSSASVPRIINNQIHLPPDFQITRDIFLFFSVTGFVVALLVTLIYGFNFVSVKPFNRLPLVLIIIVIDLIWLVSTFIMAIMCATKEETLNDPIFIYGAFINKGAFGVASFFGFVCSIFYGLEAGFLIVQAKRGSLV